MNRSRLADGLIAAAIAVLAATACFHAMDWHPSTYHASSAQDIWFDADGRRVFWLEVDRDSSNERATLHPFQRVLSYPPVFILRKAFGLASETAVHAFHAIIAGAWAAAFFLLLRRIGLFRPDALVFTGVAAVSSAGLFWLPVTESFVAGSLSMFPALALAARPTARPLPHLVAMVSSLSMTVTNLMVGFFSALTSLGRKHLVIVSAAALAAAALGIGIDRLAFPEGQVFLEKPADEAAWVLPVESGGPFAIFRVFFVSGMVAPEFRFNENWLQPRWPTLSFQTGGLLSGGKWAMVATPAWLLILLAGAWSLWKDRSRPALRATLTLAVLWQLLLHLVYGRETFLYAIHFIPLLVLVAAQAALTRLRPAVLALAVVLIVSTSFNNVPLFSWGKAYSARHAMLKKFEESAEKAPARDHAAIRYRFWKEVK